MQQWMIKKIGIDRLLHFAFGGWLACLAPNWYIALLIGFVIGLVKELSDRCIKKSKFDIWDLSATFLGSIISALIILLCN